MGCPVLAIPTVVSTFGGLVFGYELGIISGALMPLQVQFRLTYIQQEAVVSTLLIGAVFASLVGGWLIDRHGRRTSILVSNLLILGGSLILSSSNSFLMLVMGRLLVGFAICISSMSCCIFVSEIVPSHRRGLMVTLYEAGVTIGILVAYAVNYVLAGVLEGWRYMFGLAVAPCLAQLISVWVFPLQNQVLVHHLPENENQSDCLEEQPASDQVLKDHKHFTICHLFQRKDNLHTRMIIGLGLVLFQQFTGQPNVLFYASTILQSVGFKNYASAVLASLGLGIVKVITTFVAMLCADRVGRRPLLISGCSVMAVGLLLIGVLCRNSLLDATRHCSSKPYFNNTMLVHKTPIELSMMKIGNHTTDAELFPTMGSVNWLILICMMSVVGAFSVSFGPMTWLILSEIFPAELRGRAFAFTNCFNWVANLIVSFSFLSVIDVIGLSGTFFIYGVIAVAAVAFIYFLLPETKGKSLEDIDQELRQKRRFPHKEEFCIIFQRRLSPNYQRLSWTNTLSI